MFNIEMYRSSLEQQVRSKTMSRKTMQYYLSCIERLDEECKRHGTEGKFAPHELEIAINKLVGESKQGAKVLAAIKKYERDVLGVTNILLYGEPLQRLNKKYYINNVGKEPSLPESTYLKKINRLGNDRLQLAFRLQYRSGLRIGEVAALDKNSDIKFNEEKKAIHLYVRNGKGNKSRVVQVENDKFLYDKLEQHIREIPEDEIPFYSESYLKKKAGEHGIQTHDLRRISGRQAFRDARTAGKTRRESRAIAARKLGHEQDKTTNIYLGKEWRGGEEDE